MRTGVGTTYRPTAEAGAAGVPGTRQSVLGAGLFRLAIAGLFALTMCLSIYLVKFGVAGLPFRAFTACLILLAASVMVPSLVFEGLKAARPVLVVIAVAAAAGVASSLLSGAEIAVIARQILEIHVQAMIATLVGVCVLRICGPRTVLFVLCATVGLSAAFAVLQYAKLSIGWDVRIMLQNLQPAEVPGAESSAAFWLALRIRALGLSFSPVILGSQLCLVFAAMVAYRARTVRFENLGFDPVLIATFLFVCFGSLASGNRSPILGCAVMLVVFFIMARPVYGLIGAILAVPAVLGIDLLVDTAADTGLRVAQSNSSSENRAVLRAFGTLLFIDRPWGYGLAFNSVEYAWKYWPQLMDYDNPQSILIHALHNYYFVVLNKYGFVALLVFAYVGLAVWRSRVVLIAWLPYLVHIYFHNDGPLQADFVIWFILPMFFVFYRRSGLNAPLEARPARAPLPRPRRLPSA